MKLHNTLTRQKEDFKALTEPKVTLYTCGPTVYDYLHIGNLKAFVTADLLRRTLSVLGKEVSWVINITDVDDKTIHRSLEEHADLEPGRALAKLTKTYEAAFMADVEAVGVEMSHAQLVRATDNIELMQALIRKIDEAGYAYVSGGSVYFDLAKYTEAGHRYGQLSRVDFKPQARIDNDEYGKQEARDFVLWKAVDEGEPSWGFEFQGHNLPGRPGWHIECSAMSAEYLGQPFDIHTGGVDLIFPHHENELAQSQAAHNKELARFFVHNEHLLVDGAKMSKSKHNFYTLKDITAKGFEPLTLRLLMLLAHYRSQQNFTWEALGDAQTFLYRLQAWADLRYQASPTAESRLELITTAQQVFLSAVSDDLSSPQAVAALTGTSDVLSANGLAKSDLPAFNNLLQVTDDVLGLRLLDSQDITTQQKELISQREDARKSGDFEKADQLREQLKQQGLTIDDASFGPRWSRLKVVSQPVADQDLQASSDGNGY